MQAQTAPYKRMVYLETLALNLADDMTYLQSTSYRYAPALKQVADLLAKQAGGTFAKAWRPKAASTIAAKMYFRRGRVQRGWLADALQGRINCSSTEAVRDVAAFFQSVADQQNQAADAAGLHRLPTEPSGADLLSWDISGLQHAGTGARIDQVGTFLPDLSEAGATLALLSCLLYHIFRGIAFILPTGPAGS